MHFIVENKGEEKMNHITKEEVLKGLEGGTVKIINNDNDDCISAKIGDFWFYFCGQEDEDMKADEYIKSYGLEVIAEMITNHLEEWKDDEEFGNEWEYYKAILETQ